MRAPLENLHDFYQPPPPSWRPQTIGWYVVFSIAALMLVWLALHLFRQWQENRYRREALKELAQVDVTELSALLKRTALSVWPREEVASLSGAAWLKFLGSSVHKPLFENTPANRIEEITLSATSLSDEDESTLRNAAGLWIRQHRSPHRQGRSHVSA